MPKLLVSVFAAWAVVYHTASLGAVVRNDQICPHAVAETCRWDISVQSIQQNNQPLVRVSWEKSIVSRHMEKPLAHAISCNVDRDFNYRGGGYLKVWFKGEPDACDATAMKDPSSCGVHFIFDPLAPGPFPTGFDVVAPPGKQLARVENKNTLNLQCGDFRRADFARSTWSSRVGWDASLAGDGTYSENTTK